MSEAILRLLDGPTIARILTVDLALDALRGAFRMEGEGRAGEYGRRDLSHTAGWMRVLPAVFEGLGVFGMKTIAFTRDLGVRFALDVYDLESGRLRALLDAHAITGARTGATAAVAAELLAPSTVDRSAVVGTGSVARSQLPALQAVRPSSRINVYSRDPRNRAAFIEAMQTEVEAKLVDCSSLEEAIEGASLVTLATKSSEPLLRAEHLQPGMHVNSVGSARPPLFEIEPAAFGRFDRVVCDAVELVFSEAGDAIASVEQGFGPEMAVDLGQLVAGRAPGRTDDHQITLFKSTGSGIQDLALAVAILEVAEKEGLGMVVDDLLTLKQFGQTGVT